MIDLKEITARVLACGTITDDEAYALTDVDLDALLAAAAEITKRFCPREFDSCSIVNARSGKCSENCKWCAQSAHFSTGCSTYEVVDEDTCMELAQHNAKAGVKRFSMVTSGRALKGKAFDECCRMLRRIKAETPMSTCASMGLIGIDELRKLRQAGVSRYHCNLETAPSHFPTLCITHTIDDKIATIKAAREAGLEVCSGGIIGMGETAKQRVEFGLTLRSISPVSIPINILMPIAGTPLENATPLSEDEILQAIAIMRIVNPSAQIRLAGGRTKLSRQGQLRAMTTGINGAIVGDMLTTLGSSIASDRELAHQAGYEF